MITSCTVNNNSVSISDSNQPQLIEEITADKSYTIGNLENNSTQTEPINYQQYLKKIWVVDDWSIETYLYSASFRITKIENGVIEGQLTTQSIAEPNCYSDASDYYEYTDNLYGTINNNVAKCVFDSKVGDEGEVVLEFKEDNKIDASIKYTSKGKYSADLLDGDFSFRPYNLNDIDRLVVDEDSSFEVNLDSWGNVRFVAVNILGNKPFPEAYLTNEYNDILYGFAAPYQTATEIYDVSIADLNNDGLKDVKIITYLPYAPNAYRFLWVFYQMENGWFYLERVGDIS